jgi:hypothetical protein
MAHGKHRSAVLHPPGVGALIAVHPGSCLLAPAQPDQQIEGLELFDRDHGSICS